MVDMDRAEPALEDADLTKIHAKHPKASIAFDHETQAWGAVIPGEGTAFRYVVGPTLSELAVKLGVEGGESGVCESK
jgi:hypothetical protein